MAEPEIFYDESRPGIAVEPLPVHISDEALAKLTVAKLKEQLKCGDVSIPSKARKQDLSNLLRESLELPVLRKPKDNEGTVEETALSWNEEHPARQLLFTEITSGRIPLDANEMGPAEVHCNCIDALEFKIKGMEYGSLFTSRLRRLREATLRDKSRAKDDSRAFKTSLKNHPPPRLNHRGQRQWNGSVAQALLQYDMSLGKHETLSPAELRMTRAEYQASTSVDQFRWKIHQETRTKKYLCTLKCNSEEKLRNNLEKSKKC